MKIKNIAIYIFFVLMISGVILSIYNFGVAARDFGKGVSESTRLDVVKVEVVDESYTTTHGYMINNYGTVGSSRNVIAYRAYYLDTDGVVKNCEVGYDDVFYVDEEDPYILYSALTGYDLYLPTKMLGKE